MTINVYRVCCQFWVLPPGLVKALVYLAHDYARTGFSRASAYFDISLAALESRKLRQSLNFCQLSGKWRPKSGLKHGCSLNVGT